MRQEQYIVIVPTNTKLKRQFMFNKQLTKFLEFMTLHFSEAAKQGILMFSCQVIFGLNVLTDLKKVC